MTHKHIKYTAGLRTPQRQKSMWDKIFCCTDKISRWKTHLDRVKTWSSWKSQIGWPEFHWRMFHWLSCYLLVSRHTFVLSDPWTAAVLSGQRRSSRKRWESSRQPASSQTGTEHQRWFSGLSDTRSLITRYSCFGCHLTHNLIFNSIWAAAEKRILEHFKHLICEWSMLCLSLNLVTSLLHS